MDDYTSNEELPPPESLSQDGVPSFPETIRWLPLYAIDFTETTTIRANFDIFLNRVICNSEGSGVSRVYIVKSTCNTSEWLDMHDVSTTRCKKNEKFGVCVTSLLVANGSNALDLENYRIRKGEMITCEIVNIYKASPVHVCLNFKSTSPDDTCVYLHNTSHILSCLSTT